MPVKTSKEQEALWKQFVHGMMRRDFAVSIPSRDNPVRNHIHRPVAGEEFVVDEGGDSWWNDPAAGNLPILYRIVVPRAEEDAPGAGHRGAIQVLDTHDFSETEVKSLKLVAASMADRVDSRLFLAMASTPGGVLSEEAEAGLVAEMMEEMVRVG